MSAGYFISRASWGRSLLNSRTKASNLACCWRKFEPAGRVASIFKVRCMRQGNAVVGANGLGQTAFLEQALKGSKSALFFGGFHGFTEQEITTGVVRDGEWVAVSLVPEHELAFVIGTPQSIRKKPCG